jgi:hypothetical protein
MFETYNNSGYNLYQPFSDLDQWVIDDHSKAFHGTLVEVVKYMVQKLDFDIDDVEDGINLLADNIDLHNAIHFGMFKTCIYTFNHEEKYGKRAG